MALSFDRGFNPRHGEAVPAFPGIVRITAPNANVFTFTGTNTYLLGTETLVVIDPGPDDPVHLDAVLRAIDGRTVSHILVTHTHNDHSAGVPFLAEKTGALVAGGGPHRLARAAAPNENATLDAGADEAFRPDRVLGDGDRIEAGGFVIEAVATPGHTDNHLAFALPEHGVLFPGDHVMGWATTVVAPPDGSMRDYMASLDRLLERPETLYLPGHGGPLANPHRLVRGLRTHRKMRERAILQRLADGDRTIPEMVAAIYRDLDPKLHRSASLSTLAHLEHLAERGLVRAVSGTGLDGSYERAGERSGV
ncbi:Glyoxylase, beta-lactamase superfamily II [Faunimonas pinastri]|uniref:Glyoxylase, beta-lactamase superfamily II n=1 Tax=Faunimonas pinastri TaxID=1855383 RepID=A0A1H9JJY5_9HYPH|nr:MBL fold metallo-hydrolase [Faunimonas pinastri]SEQ87083.1 Glyoxylase, beta-lactamase superfamily II [Faunimonas pinastri]